MAHLVFALDTFTHDVYRNGPRIALLRDSDAVLQTVKTRLLVHYEEWFLDLNAGLPWFTVIMTHNPNFKLIESLVTQTILGTDGVVTLKQLALSFQGEDRSLSIDFAYTDVYGNNIVESISGALA